LTFGPNSEKIFSKLKINFLGGRAWPDIALRKAILDFLLGNSHIVFRLEGINLPFGASVVKDDER
jgi:hypothetical protein